MGYRQLLPTIRIQKKTVLIAINEQSQCRYADAALSHAHMLLFAWLLNVSLIISFSFDSNINLSKLIVTIIG